MCRACEWPRLIFPLAVRRTRLAAPLWVFSFGMMNLSFCTLFFVLGTFALTMQKYKVPGTKILLRLSWRLGFYRAALMSLWSKDDEHLISFHPWPRFNFTNVGEILFELRQNPRA